MQQITFEQTACIYQSKTSSSRMCVSLSHPLRHWFQLGSYAMSPFQSVRRTLLQHADLQQTAKQDTDSPLPATFRNMKDYRPQPKAEALACFWAKPQRSESWLYPSLQNISGLRQCMSSVPAHKQDSRLSSSRCVERERAVKGLAAFKSDSQTQKQAAGMGTVNQAYKNNDQVHFRGDRFRCGREICCLVYSFH